jgi:SulP family sulfate permease
LSRAVRPSTTADAADPENRYDAAAATDRDVMVYHISGAFFFGATARVLTALERVGAPRVLVLDFSAVPFIDSTAARALVAFSAKMRRTGTKIYLSAVRQNVRQMLKRAGLKPPEVVYAASAAEVTGRNPSHN